MGLSLFPSELDTFNDRHFFPPNSLTACRKKYRNGTERLCRLVLPGRHGAGGDRLGWGGSLPSSSC